MPGWIRTGTESVGKMLGTLRLDKIENPAAYERANYLRTLKSFDERVLNAPNIYGRFLQELWALLTKLKRSSIW